MYRLAKETIFTPAGAVERTISYGYDAVGNRLTKTDSVGGVTTYVYDDNDRLLREELRQNGVLVGSVEYGYYDNGNTRTRTKKDAAGVVAETVTYSWNQENRLVGVQNSNGDAVSYAYDADGVRISKTVNGVTTEYLVDKNRDYAQVLEERVNDVLNASYVYGWDLISQERVNADSFYLMDGLGSTRGLTDASGVVIDTYNYDAFGNLIGVSGGTANNYLFAGEQFDSNLGDYYLRQRYYDTDTGRFTRRDTYEGRLEDPMSLHKYLYTHANPVNFTDPTGLFTTELAATIATSTALSSVGGAVIGGAFTAIAGGSSSDILIGAGKGALAGGITGLTAVMAGPALAGLVGGGVWGGILSGAVSGVSGNLGLQVLDLTTGNQEEFQVESFLYSAVLGGIFGAIVLRPYTAPQQQVTHWSSPVRPRFEEGQKYWVMTGGPSVRNYSLAGIRNRYPYGSHRVDVVDGSKLTYPEKWEAFKGLMGQRVYKP